MYKGTVIVVGNTLVSCLACGNIFLFLVALRGCGGLYKHLLLSSKSRGLCEVLL